MANTDTPMGLNPVRNKNGDVYTGAASPYYLATGETNNIFVGDPVVISGTANTAPVAVKDGDFQKQYPAGSLPAITLATAGAAGNITGVVVGIEASPDNGLNKTYRAASTAAVAWVADNPDLVFEVQEDSAGGALAAADVGTNVNLVSGTGSTITGKSAWELDSSSKGTGTTIQCRLERLVNRDDNEIGTNAKWEVSIVTHTRNSRAGI